MDLIERVIVHGNIQRTAECATALFQTAHYPSCHNSTRSGRPEHDHPAESRQKSRDMRPEGDAAAQDLLLKISGGV